MKFNIIAIIVFALALSALTVAGCGAEKEKDSTTIENGKEEAGETEKTADDGETADDAETPPEGNGPVDNGEVVDGGGEAPVPTDLTLSGELEDEEITIKKGGTLTCELAGNATTGFEWIVKKPEGDTVLKHLTPDEYEVESGLIGAGGVQSVRFEAVEAGTTDVLIEYRRRWEKDKPAEKTFSLKVTVVE